ncbi:carboxymuconolactone decarboxylase family protein [Pseudomaricurvus sp. HS19]|uniref:carboxymuconolactone decarboxylase family protein n=1 Tax=Pseudomaricurvus sp. HS19 TaxID=2692626 RepID=UPI001369E51E|nr:carboxymuconolactone decarboxylase family protein [Pseudomaricurvus sp. HS19]MYM63566.1 carboxymuconolactone decarboxylase family protein [Pseudomaricurvus sp. HS19]
MSDPENPQDTSLPPDPPARIPPLAPEERNEAQQQVVDIFSAPGRLPVNLNPVLATLAQHPPVAAPFLRFNNYLLTDSTLPVRLRQLAILRTTWLQRGVYPWSSHLRTSLRNGLQESDFAPVQEGSGSAYFNAEERAVLRAVEQLLAQARLDDDHWQALTGFLSQQQVMDLLFTVGTYSMLCMVSNSLGIGREEDLRQLAARFGAPEWQ